MAFDRTLIEKYATGVEHLEQAIRGLTRDDLMTPVKESNAGKWTIQQVIIHVADSDQVLADRMKAIIAEDNPTLINVDETKWAQKLHYHDQSIEDAIQIMKLTRRQMSVVLRQLSDEAFERVGTHSVRGKITLATFVKAAADHLEHHLKFVHAKRAAMGKEMW